MPGKYVLVCQNEDCKQRGSDKLLEQLAEKLKGDGDVEVKSYMCFGGCHDGPNVVLYPDKVWYAGVKEEDADAIVDKHLKQGETLPPLMGKVDKSLEEMIYQLLDAGIF